MMHFGMEGRARGEIAGEIPYNALSPLRECVDYLALGHYHTQYEYDSWVYNGGSLEMISLSEYGLKKGFYHVTDEGARLVTLPTRQFKRLSASISRVQSVKELTLLLQSIVESEPPVDSKLQPVVELTLWGELNFPKKEIPLQTLKEIISKRFNCLYVDLHIKEIDDAYALNENEIRGMSREEIETKILREQVLKDTRYRAHARQVVSDIIEAKKLALLKVDEREIIHRLKQSFKEIHSERERERREDAW